MGLIKGQADYARWKKGLKLTRQEAIDANCYICNGRDSTPCGGEINCVLYQYSPFRQKPHQEGAENTEKCHSPEIPDLQTVGEQ
jgi:hypothetical protein